MPPANLRRTVSSELRHSPVPKDSRAARAARRDRVVLAEIELWRSVAGQVSTPSRRSSAASDGSFVDENGSVAGSLGTEDDVESVMDEDAAERSEIPSPVNSTRRRRPLRPARQATSTRTLRPLPSRTLSLSALAPPADSPEIRSLELDVAHMGIFDGPAVRAPSTPRRRSTRLRL